MEAELDADFAELMTLADKHTKMSVRTNADTPHDAKVARKFGATVSDSAARNTCSSKVKK